MFDTWRKRVLGAFASLALVLGTALGLTATSANASVSYVDTSLQADGFSGLFQQTNCTQPGTVGAPAGNGTATVIFSSPNSSTVLSGPTVSGTTGATASVNGSGQVVVTDAHTTKTAGTGILQFKASNGNCIDVITTAISEDVLGNITSTNQVQDAVHLGGAPSYSGLFADDDNATGGVKFYASSTNPPLVNALQAHVSNLPSGLNGNVGNIATEELLPGTAIPGQYDDVIVTVTDSLGASTTGVFHLKVNGHPVHSPVLYQGPIVLKSNGLCLDDRFNAGTGAVVQIWRCNGSQNQQWTVMRDGTIAHLGLGCLTAPQTLRGAKLTLAPCPSSTPSENQSWSTKHWHIWNASGLVVDDTGWGGSGTPQELWENNGGANQLWQTV